MANEISYRHVQTGETLYAVIVDADPHSANVGKYWDAVAAAFDALTVVDWGDYDIPLAESPAGGYRYLADFPASIPAGIYDVMVFVRGGGAPAIADDLRQIDRLIWTGAKLQPPEKLMELLAAIEGGAATYDAATGVWTVKKQDGTSTAFVVTLAGSGNRTAPVVS